MLVIKLKCKRDSVSFKKGANVSQGAKSYFKNREIFNEGTNQRTT